MVTGFGGGERKTGKTGGEKKRAFFRSEGGQSTLGGKDDSVKRKKKEKPISKGGGHGDRSLGKTCSRREVNLTTGEGTDIKGGKKRLVRGGRKVGNEKLPVLRKRGLRQTIKERKHPVGNPISEGKERKRPSRRGGRILRLVET